MTYLKLKNRLQISLTKTETEKIFGSIDSIDKNNPRTAFALKTLFKKAVKEQVFPAADSVWVEITKNTLGGYDVFFSKNKPCANSNYTSVAVLEFENLEDAVKAAKTFNINRPSRLYKYFGHYRIVVCLTNEKHEIPLALEFANIVYTDFTETAKTMEHGTVLIKEKAFEILSAF